MTEMILCVNTKKVQAFKGGHDIFLKTIRASFAWTLVRPVADAEN